MSFPLLNSWISFTLLKENLIIVCSREKVMKGNPLGSMFLSEQDINHQLLNLHLIISTLLLWSCIKYRVIIKLLNIRICIFNNYALEAQSRVR